METGKVVLVGAGCGDPEYLTLKAARLIEGCEVLVYDSLVAKQIVDRAPADCEKIYVGKRYGQHSMRQDEINQILIDKAKEGKNVVRLKGGDPYVFGRGGEEALALQKEGILCQEIPGITSSIAVPAVAGIPVTHRGMSRSVTILTGTTLESGVGGKNEKKDGAAKFLDGVGGMEYSVLAQIEGTLVILMGMHRLKEIAEGLMKAGKSAQTPAAVIMEGTTEKQRIVRGTLENIAALSEEAGLKPPAVIVIGEVAALELTGSEREEIKETGKLAGLRIGVTGTEGFSSRMMEALKQAGAETVDMSFMKAEASKEPLPNLTEASWLVFTSPNGVRIFFEKMGKERLDYRVLGTKKIAVIGPGTGRELEKYGFYADYMPEVFDAAHLAEGLSECIRLEKEEGKTVGRTVFLRASKGNPVLAHTFTKKGLDFEEFALYELNCDAERAAAIPGEKVDYLVFGSASGVRAWMEKYRDKAEETTCVCIGEQCAKALGEAGFEDYLTARPYTVEGIVACLCAERAIR